MLTRISLLQLAVILNLVLHTLKLERELTVVLLLESSDSPLEELLGT